MSSLCVIASGHATVQQKLVVSWPAGMGEPNEANVLTALNNNTVCVDDVLDQDINEDDVTYTSATITIEEEDDDE
ncbi:hypothetical protein [Bifidobacterium scardovii]|uniref:Uncharacterized protein n=1 Tax=Bifidobacterium scardovii TaxID=158787 RepID=A0A087DGQ2_9BIFI|nr:hypothetical protein [Bifidobacterium scardovii]KFI94702.1 hypothetical protein BSCA_0754 [Bifidobacterium scardovii]MDK6349839.1 hypothetical protein [Bifidobacterium scardovii]MDU8982543.1 hypothetical protein [Bifidobacterium scardovii]DAE55513.1 MAG TPA: hypothetical protein [Caudoviricetes sp.]